MGETIVLHQTWMMTAVYTFRLHAARPNLKLYAGQLHQRRIPLAPSSILHRWLCPAAYHRIAKSQLFQLLLTKTVFRNNYSWISENHTAHYKWENQALSSRELHPRKRTCRSRNSWVTFFRLMSSNFWFEFKINSTGSKTDSCTYILFSESRSQRKSNKMKLKHLVEIETSKPEHN